MSRTIPRAYVTAAWNKNSIIAQAEAKKYCRELVKEGYLPLCPVLVFDGLFSSDDMDSHKRKKRNVRGSASQGKIPCNLWRYAE